MEPNKRTIEEQNEHEDGVLKEIKEQGEVTGDEPTREQILEEHVKRMEEEGNPHINDTV